MTTKPGEHLGPLLAMVDALDGEAVREIAVLLTARLVPIQTAEERRSQELGFLAGMHEIPEARGSASARMTPLRSYYDEHRPRSAPQSQRLCERYGSWTQACRAARALTDAESGARAWNHGFTGKRRPADYNQDEVIQAVLGCAADLGHIPSSSAFFKWVSRRKAEARTQGADLRLPRQASVYRKFRNWDAVREAVGAALHA